jgi:AbrB family looped-hinge helix DNA binding protein
MDNLATTKLSSKGQVVIPENIRDKMDLKPGHQFVVLGNDNVVILKSIEPPSFKDFDALISKSRKEARKAGLTKKDLLRAIKAARRKR